MTRLFRHESAFGLDLIGSIDNTYRPNQDFGGGTWINEQHKSISEIPLQGPIIRSDIPGWLQRADALKLYELAYFSATPIIELGTYQGLSASIMASARKASKSEFSIITVDIDNGAVQAAAANLERAGLGGIVGFNTMAANDFCAKLFHDGVRSDFCFVDHSHSYEETFAACEWMKHLIVPGGFVLFHDFNDARNTTDVNVGEKEDVYGIVNACLTSFGDDSFSFWGVYGCTGLFRKADGPTP